MEKKGAKDKLTNCTKNNLQLTYGPGSTLCSRIFNFWTSTYIIYIGLVDKIQEIYDISIATLGCNFSFVHFHIFSLSI